MHAWKLRHLRKVTSYALLVKSFSDLPRGHKESVRYGPGQPSHFAVGAEWAVFPRAAEISGAGLAG